jgi:hypothetical protein
MNKPLNLLLVEDSQDDAELIVAELKNAGFAPQWKRVETEAAFLAAIETPPDLVLSDYSMPRFSGLKALALLRAKGLDVPVILVSGTVDEGAVAEARRNGVADYVLKDEIGRLGPAVERALEKKRLSDERKSG